VKQFRAQQHSSTAAQQHSSRASARILRTSSESARTFEKVSAPSGFGCAGLRKARVVREWFPFPDPECQVSQALSRATIYEVRLAAVLAAIQPPSCFHLLASWS